MLGGNKRTHIFTKTRSQKLEVCLSVFDLLLSPNIKNLSKFQQINPVQFPLNLSEPRSFQIISEEEQWTNALKRS